MEKIALNQLRLMALTTGKSVVFRDVVSGEQYYATRRVANEILQAQRCYDDIPVFVQNIKTHEDKDRSFKPYERMSWLATPSRF